MITVMKFGGTSVGSGEALKRAAKIIVDEKGQKVVVVSAMSGITNFLVSAVEENRMDLNDVTKKFRDSHLDVAKNLFSGKLMEEYMAEFEKRYRSFEELILDQKRKDDPFYEDNVSSQGERFSSLLLSYVIKSMGFKSVSLTSEDAGVYAVGRPMTGSCDLARTAKGLNVNVRLLLNDDVIPVLTGFYGVNPEGKPLTFGRGGSDYAAAAIGNAIDADCIQIWTDVDGFMSADPRIVPDAVTINEMNFSEAAELAHFGAKVLHSRTIEPARLKHIPLWVKNSYKPENHGTIIHHIKGQRNEPLRSVAMKLDLSILTVTVGEISYKPVLLAKIMEKLSEAEIIIYGISTSLSNIALLVHNLDIKRCLALLHMLDSIDIEKINVRNNMTLICAVGDGLLNRCGFCGDVFGAVKEVGASVEMISEGASEVALNFVVATDYATEVVKTIHKKFITGSV